MAKFRAKWGPLGELEVQGKVGTSKLNLQASQKAIKQALGPSCEARGGHGNMVQKPRTQHESGNGPK